MSHLSFKVCRIKLLQAGFSLHHTWYRCTLQIYNAVMYPNLSGIILNYSFFFLYTAVVLLQGGHCRRSEAGTKASHCQETYERKWRKGNYLLSKSSISQTIILTKQLFWGMENVCYFICELGNKWLLQVTHLTVQVILIWYNRELWLILKTVELPFNNEGLPCRGWTIIKRIINAQQLYCVCHNKWWCA